MKHSKLHIQGLIGLFACGLHILVRSIPVGKAPNALCAGLPMWPRCSEGRSLVADGDELTVDFANGLVQNQMSCLGYRCDPLPYHLMACVKADAWSAMFAKRLQAADLGGSLYNG